MPAATICTVSGTIRDLGGTAITNATVSFSSIRPFVSSTDSTLYVNYSVSASTDASGNFSLGVVETTTNSVSLILTISYALGSAANAVITQYYVTIPNSPTATLASLISGQ